MSVHIKLKKQRGAGVMFTFSIEAGLTLELVKSVEMEKALKALAKRLVEQHPIHRGTGEDFHDAIGIEFHEISFNYILDPAKTMEQETAERLLP